MFGLPKGQVFLVPWTKNWREEFLLKKEKIQNEISKFVIDIHHIGSTAVRVLSAKPIIDIAIKIEDFNEGKHWVTPLEKLGYSYSGINIIPERRYFSKGEPRTHQIHMYQTGSTYNEESIKT